MSVLLSRFDSPFLSYSPSLAAAATAASAAPPTPFGDDDAIADVAAGGVVGGHGVGVDAGNGGVGGGTGHPGWPGSFLDGVVDIVS